MAFLDVHFFSEALRVQASVWVILPEERQGIGVAASAGRKPPKVLYLLHGYSDDHTIWLRRTGVERYAAGHNLAVIMPAVNHSFYTNEAQGERYFDYVAEELPAAMHRFLRLSERPEDTFVAGLSMGGYGAMKLALTHPERYRMAASFSGALDVALRASSRPEFARIFGRPEKVPGSEHDLYALLERQAAAPARPKLIVSCCSEDGLLQDSRRFVREAGRLGWDTAWREVPGYGHAWELWDAEIARFIPLAMAED